MKSQGRRLSHMDQAMVSLNADEPSRLIEAAADLALVLDPDGTVRDYAFRDSAFESVFKDADTWRGRKLVEFVTAESRPKAISLLEAAAKDQDPQLRQLNHAAQTGAGVAVEYAAVRAGRGGPIIAFGRDLRPMAVLQQRLLEAQQAMSRDYAALRQAQARYRVLFETAPGPLFVLDAETARITDANPAGLALPAPGGRRLIGRSFADLFEAADRSAVNRFLSALIAAGRVDPVRARLAGEGADGAPDDVELAAALLTEDDQRIVIVRLVSRAHAVPDPTELRDRLLSALDQAPDAFVFTGPDGNVLAVNSAFLAMAQVPHADGARGASLETWLGQPGVDVPVLLANLKQRGTVRLFRTSVRGVGGLTTDVEISAVAVFGAEPSYGFAIRDVGRRIGEPSSVEQTPVMPRSVEQLTELIGRVSLKDLVRDATDVIERLCIEAALELTGDNRASAAEMLGLSRQSLYVKLRRYGLGDLDEEP